MKEFYIILPSNGCKDTQPNNNASDFIIQWNNPYNLQGKWQVALTEFKRNFPIYTLPANSKIHIETINLPKGLISLEKIEFEPAFSARFNNNNNISIYQQLIIK